MPLLTPKKLPASLLHKGTPLHSSIRKIGRRILVHLTKGMNTCEIYFFIGITVIQFYLIFLFVH